MIPANLSKKLLSVGPEFLPPKGGIAQVIFNYREYIFPANEYRYIANSCEGNQINKIFKLIASLVQYVIALTFQRQIKIVHIHTASYFSFKRSSWFVGLAKLFRKKIILHIHGGGFKEYYANEIRFVRHTLAKCDTIVVLTEAWAKWFRTEVGVDNLVVVPNVIPEPAKCENIEKDDKFHVLFLGLINDQKGIFDLINAIKLNQEKLNGQFELHVGGNGQVERLKNEITENNLEGIVKYEGWVGSVAKHNLLCRCDALILPSYIEGLPLSILEAMAYRKAVITTPVGGIPSMIEDGTNGFLVEPGDGSAFVDKIVFFMENRDKACEMGEISGKAVEKYFPVSVSHILKSIYESYK